MNRIVLAGCLAIVAASCFAQTLEERKQIVERAKAVVQREDRPVKKLFSIPFYTDYNKVFYSEGVWAYRDGKSVCINHVKRFDIETATSTIFVPLPLHRAFNVEKVVLADPVQRAVFEDDRRFVLIEMNFEKESWKPVLYFSEDVKIDCLREVPHKNQFAFTYPQNGFEHNNPDLFGLDVVDVDTGERRNILSNIKRQNTPPSSMWNYLPFLFLNEETLVYSETCNPYRITDEFLLGDRFYEKDKSKHPYNALWRLNFVSGDKIQLATCDLQMSSELKNAGKFIIWNKIKIGSATDILYRK